MRSKTEEVARALCRRRNTGQCAPICLSYSSLCTNNGECPEALRVFGEDARAAIIAMREPTQEILDAGCNAVSGVTYLLRVVEPTYWTKVWQAMIDASLQEGLSK